ncbi:CLUMA_CG011269, isoform A [Clunio marinus]|uniref:CLUMA_CG011269, isoform A n=1 Tax=Clunio marinus TaxID=568069 RepID=A0A1J1IFT3_9DIPT|nr:CLUMA_CG011269, isoform A [Clunio marinus]
MNSNPERRVGKEARRKIKLFKSNPDIFMLVQLDDKPNSCFNNTKVVTFIIVSLLLLTKD